MLLKANRPSVSSWWKIINARLTHLTMLIEIVLYGGFVRKIAVKKRQTLLYRDTKKFREV